MTTRFGILLSVLLVASCGYQYPGLMVSPFKLSMGMTHPTSSVAPPPPAVDYADFRPAGGSMTTETKKVNSGEISLGFEVFQELPMKFVTGFSYDFVTFGGTGIFSQPLRQTTLYWWDPVLSEQLVMEKTPSVGGYFGTMILGPTIQYGVSVCRYNIKEYLYSGVDVYGGTNYSIPKSATLVTSGRSVRHLVEIGYREAVRFGVWFESDGRQTMVGFQMIISAAATFFPPPAPPIDCETANPANHYHSYEEELKYNEYCGKK